MPGISCAETEKEPESCGSVELHGPHMAVLKGLSVGDEVMLHLKVKINRLSSYENEYEGKTSKDSNAGYEIKEIAVMQAGQPMEGLYGEMGE